MFKLYKTYKSKLFIALFILFTFSMLLSCISDQKKNDIKYDVEAPAGGRYCAINKQGETIIPNGRIIKPYGNSFSIAPHPYGLTLSPDGKTAITANSGISPFSISIIKDINSPNPTINQIPEGFNSEEGVLDAVFMGLAVSPDNKYVYVSGGIENQIFIFDLESNEKTDSINCAKSYNGKDYSHGYLGDLVLTADGKQLIVVDQINFCVNIIDVSARKIVQRVDVGRYPFGICLSPDEKKVYVANVGMFEYSFLEGITLENYQNVGLMNPTSAYLSEEGKKGYQANDSINVPGLGDPNDMAAFSVWTILLKDSAYVSSKTKTGYQVGEKIEGIPAVGGSSPNSLVATDKYVFVSNGNNDIISVLDIQSDTVVKEIFLQLDERFMHLRGIIPFGLAVSPDNKRLYVAESGINAVGVIDIESLELIGHIPVGWFPSKLEVTPDGKKLIVANAKGYGSGPNGGKNFKQGNEGWYIGNLMKGSLSIFNIPGDEKLKELSQLVLENNFKIEEHKDTPNDNPIPGFPGEKESPIKYIVFISKENRTYDEVYGQVDKGLGEPELARYGRRASFTNNNKTDSLENADIMVNHLKLASEYAISDNFYVDSDVSADGHRWLVCTYPNEWTETGVAASYGGRRSFKIDSKAPGNFAFVGASGAIYPEDYNEAGSMWEHLERNNISIYNFGFGLEMSGTYADSTMKYAGVRYLVNYPVPEPVFEFSSELYPTFNMAIPDQFRADIFIKEYQEKWLDSNNEPPQLITVMLPNDHGAGDRPNAGYPFRESYMCDNDLALGRIIEFLSSTPYWKNMAVFITEDDAQNGRDHIDAHRSLLLVASPYAKKDHVSHVHNSFGSIFKTFWNILGIPYLNQYDAGATDLSDMFTSNPDFSPYYALEADKRVFDPQKALTPFDEEFNWKAVINSPKLDNPEDMIQE